MAFDDKWFNKIENLVSVISPVRCFSMNMNLVNVQKNDFFAGVIENPSFEYPSLKSGFFIENLEKLNKLRLLVEKEESCEIVKKMYLAKIDEKVIEIKLIESAADKNWNEFMNANMSLYYSGVKWHYERLVKRILRNISILENNKANERYNLCFEKIKNTIGSGEGKPLVKLNSKVRRVVYERMQGKLGMVDDLLIKDRFNAYEAREIFENLLKQMRYTNWEVTLMDNEVSKTSISVDQNNRTIRIPSQRFFSRRKMKSLLVHEILTHVARRENAEKSNLKLLRLGLDHYLMGEEGIATVCDQSLSKTSNYKGEPGFIAVCIAIGLGGGKNNFRGVFEFMKEFYLYRMILKNSINVDFEQKSRELAWNYCLRIFRGTGCSDPGVCYMKDAIYMVGNYRIWKLIRSDPEAMKYFDIGKYDPSNKKHVGWLKSLKLIE